MAAYLKPLKTSPNALHHAAEAGSQGVLLLRRKERPAQRPWAALSLLSFRMLNELLMVPKLKHAKAFTQAAPGVLAMLAMLAQSLSHALCGTVLEPEKARHPPRTSCPEHLEPQLPVAPNGPHRTSRPLDKRHVRHLGS